MPRRRVVIDHLSIGVSDLARSRDFYSRALLPLGFAEIGAWSQASRAVAFGLEEADDFAISTLYPSGGPVHVAFAADRREQVDAFYAVAVAAGGTTGPRACGLSTPASTTERSCSTLTETTLRLSIMDGPDASAPAVLTVLLVDARNPDLVDGGVRSAGLGLLRYQHAAALMNRRRSRDDRHPSRKPMSEAEVLRVA